MIPEIGYFALIAAWVVAVVQCLLPLWGSYRLQQQFWMQIARPAAVTQHLLVWIAFLALVWAFVEKDYSINYVVEQSNSALPVYYRIAAVWGGHEGSLLLWALVLSGWSAAVALFSRSLPPILVARIISIMGAVAVGFILFLLATSNPFTRSLPYFPVDGKDLNPLLQDVGLIFHPPILYMGYVGFSVAFAFAIAGLLGGRLDAAWARWMRPWTIAAWCFLSLGIALGSWWAYAELGWGGWWFWDPVENASFMPWLTGTALIHSLAATEKRGVFKAWTALLAIITFSLSLLGTFLVRSGVLTSVHAFASDPTRGLFILIFLCVVIGGSLTLFAFRANTLTTSARYKVFSRETLLLGNNILLAVAASIVLLGTLYPLLADVLGLGKISVGPPYFNALLVPLAHLLLILLGIGMVVRWKDQSAKAAWQTLRKPALFAVIVGLLLPLFAQGNYQIRAALALIFVFWVVGVCITDLLVKVRAAETLWQGIKRIKPSYWGMLCAHIGFVVTVVGITMASLYSLDKDIRLAPGESIDMASFAVTFQGVRDVRGPNYDAIQGEFDVYQSNHFITRLYPEKRTYWVRQDRLTEAAIDTGWTRDIYVALGEPLDKGAWAVRIYVKPFVRWMWGGAVLMALGGLLVIIDRRYRKNSFQESLDVRAA